MIKMKPWRIAFAMLAAFSLASCSKEKDGDWDPMEWKSEEHVPIIHGIYKVSADEGAFTFTCSNYSKPWFSNAKENEKDVFPSKDEVGGKLIDSENFRAEILGNKLTVHFKENEGAQERNFSITVTAGDIFYTFNFEQAANTVWLNTCQVTYSIFAISDDLMKFYDISVEYLDVDGQLHTEVITGNSWNYTPAPLSLTDAPEEFKCRIVAVLKDNLPELTADYYEIAYGVDVHVAYLTPGGKEVFRVKQPQLSSFSWSTTKAGMQSLLDDMPVIELATCSPTLSKSEVFERIKSEMK